LHQLRFGTAQGAGRGAHLLVDRAQLPAGIAALSFQLAAFGGDVLQLAVDLLELALGLARALLRLHVADDGDRQQRRDQGETTQHRA
jgi:hypothetical protein